MAEHTHEEKALVNLVKQIPNCKCGELGEENHPCPFAQDIHDDSETLCNCCENCNYECCMDI